MTSGDPILWTNPTTGKEQPGSYVSTYGRWSIIGTLTETGHLGLRYVHPGDVRSAADSAEHT
jgi:hypothetical protein